MAKKRNNQLKDANWPVCFLLPDYCGCLPPLARRFVPRRQVRAFVNGVTEQEAPEVDLCLKVAAIAANFLRVHGFDHNQSNEHIELFGQLAQEHTNEGCRSLMAALRKYCWQANIVKADAMLRTLLEAHALLREAPTALLADQQDWRKAQATYAERLGIPCS